MIALAEPANTRSRALIAGTASAATFARAGRKARERACKHAAGGAGV
jgi:hypothetical protein